MAGGSITAFAPLASAIVAAAGLIATYIYYRLGLAAKRRERIRTSLQALVAKLDSSQIATIDPHFEHWLFGFPSLEELRKLASEAHVEVTGSAHVPATVQRGVAGILEGVNHIMTFRDGLMKLAAGKPLTHLHYEKWPERPKAELALKILQDTASGALPALRAEIVRLQ